MGSQPAHVLVPAGPSQVTPVWQVGGGEGGRRSCQKCQKVGSVGARALELRMLLSSRGVRVVTPVYCFSSLSPRAQFPPGFPLQRSLFPDFRQGE